MPTTCRSRSTRRRRCTRTGCATASPAPGIGVVGRILSKRGPHDPAAFRQDDRGQPHRHVPPAARRRAGDGRERADRRRARRARQHGVGRGLRRADRPGRLLGVEGRGRRHDAARRARPRAARDPRLHRSRPASSTRRWWRGCPTRRASRWRSRCRSRTRLGRPDEYAQLVVRHRAERLLNAETIRLDGAVRLAPR